MPVPGRNLKIERLRSFGFSDFRLLFGAVFSDLAAAGKRFLAEIGELFVFFFV